MRNPLHHCMFTLVLLGLIACGSDQPEAAEAATPPEPPATIDAEAVVGSMAAYMEQMSIVFEQLADALADVDTQAAADALATRIREDMTPRLLDTMEASIIWAEEHVLPLSEQAREELGADIQALIEDDTSELNRQVNALESRIDQAGMRADQQLMTLAQHQPELAMPIGYAMMEFGSHVERLLDDERYLALEALMASDAGAVSPQAGEVGSPEWCRRMANTPQAQWSMNDGFAFASHCIGG